MIEKISKILEKLPLNGVWNAIEKLEKAIDENNRKMGALGARWGTESESAFREGMATILKDFGIKVERIIFYDDECYVFSHPSEIEPDLVIYDSKVIAIEIKSSVDKGDVALLE